METFGERLEKAIKTKKLTQAALAEKLGKKGKNVISNWVNGNAKPSADDLAEIATLLEVSVDWLLTGKESYSIPQGQHLISSEEYIEYQKFKIEKLQTQNEKLKNIEVVSLGQ